MKEFLSPSGGNVSEQGFREPLPPDVLRDAEAAEAALESLAETFRRVRDAIDAAILPSPEKDVFRRVAASRLAPILAGAELARKRLRNVIG